MNKAKALPVRKLLTGIRDVVQRRSSQEAADASILSEIKRRGLLLPHEIGSWAVGLDDVLAIDDEVVRFLQRETIKVVEFGSGASTFSILSRLDLSFSGRYVFTSHEADQRWCSSVQTEISERFPNALGFDLRHSTYKSVSGIPNFDVASCLDGQRRRSIDIIVVDAPPDTNGIDVRLRLCLELLPYLSLSGILMLHDVSRINEFYAFNLLADKFRASALYETKKGLGVLYFPLDVENGSPL
jgi:hypothetical protein